VVILNNNEDSSRYEIINSLKFYFMLSTYLISKEYTEYESTKSLKEFIKEGVGIWHSIGNKTLSGYYSQTYKSLPAEFLSFMKISSKGDSDQIRFLIK